jgi:hypothetical protein
MLPFPDACLITARVSVALFPKFAHNLMHTRCRIHREIASGQIHGSKWNDVKISTPTQLRAMLYTNSQDVLVLSSAVASRYYNCCTESNAECPPCSQTCLKPCYVHIKTNSMVRVRERSIPTERPPLVGGVVANFCG